MNELLQDKIDQYILNEMDEKQKADFYRQLQNDPSLRQQYDFTRMVRQAICSRADIEEMMKQWDEEEKTKQANSANPSARLRFNISYWVGVAAGLAIVFTIFTFIQTPEMDKPMATMSGVVNKAASTAAPKNSYADSTTNSPDLTEINNLYLEHHYLDALALIEEKERIENTTATLDADQSPDPQSISLMWLKANILINLNRTQEAIPLLKQLKQTEGIYKAMADTLLQHIIDANPQPNQ